jgi:Uma2 family endonuclease
MQQLEKVIYPTGDGEPVAETYMHLWAIFTTLAVLRDYLKTLVEEQGLPPEHEGTVLANQYLFYEEGKRNVCIAPDVMVIPHVPPGGRDSYYLWIEKQVPSIVFEMTSASTRGEDLHRKKNIYQQLGIREYWLFDPKGEWIKEQLMGYRLEDGVYLLITDLHSTVLGLRLEVQKLSDGAIINFYRLDTGKKLLTPDEEKQRAERLANRLRALGIDPDTES